MKKSTLILGFLLAIAACNNDNKNIPDVSEIKVNTEVQRFDKDFFSIDTNRVAEAIPAFFQKYPVLFPIYIQNILGLDSSTAVPGIRQFIRQSYPVYDTVAKVFADMEPVRKEFNRAFQFVKYYFPGYNTPKLVTVVGPIDALAQSSFGYTPNFLGPDFLGISLQFYLGPQYSIYNDPFFTENVAPFYRSRRFSKEYIIADGMQLIADDIYPDNSKSKPLVEQMIERGKQWWLMKKFMPEYPDSIITGYTQQQVKWCKENEGLIWSYISKNEDLNAIDPTTIQTYIGEGPFTQGFSQELSPGNLGQWLGWQIVNKYAEKNAGMHPREVIKASARTILDQAKYRPK